MLDSFELGARRQAVNDFHRARTQAALQQMASRLTGKSPDLLSYQTVARQLKVTGRAARGLQSIPLAAIVGSVGRYQDFSRTFLPRRASDEDRWVSVRTAGQMRELPPTEVYQIGQVYFVLDDNHRVSIAHQQGLDYIEAYVTEMRTRVPLSPGIQPDELIIKAEYADFLEHTKLDQLRLVPVVQENQGPASARNTGYQRARGEIVLFIDDDVVPVPELIAEHARWHETHGGNVVVLGPMLTPPNFKMTPWVQWEQAMLAKQYEAMQNVLWQPTARQFYTGNSSVAREHLLAVGGFDTGFRRAEDLELAYRLADKGLRFVFNPQAIGYHYAWRTFASWMAIPYAYGRNEVIFTYQKGQTWLLPLVLREFWWRHFLIRSMTWLCLDRPRLSQLSVAAVKHVIEKGYLSDRVHLTNMACSSIFNLRYYQGIADELGGRQAFLAAAMRARAEGQQPDKRWGPKSPVALTRER